MDRPVGRREWKAGARASRYGATSLSNPFLLPLVCVLAPWEGEEEACPSSSAHTRWSCCCCRGSHPPRSSPTHHPTPPPRVCGEGRGQAVGPRPHLGGVVGWGGRGCPIIPPQPPAPSPFAVSSFTPLTHPSLPPTPLQACGPRLYGRAGGFSQHEARQKQICPLRGIGVTEVRAFIHPPTHPNPSA